MAKEHISKTELFLGFLQIGLSGFGGVLPWTRRIIVEQKQWLTEDEFAELLGLGQILPGPNVMNLSMMLGARYQGNLGSLLCATGILLAPTLIVLALAILFGQFANIPAVHNAFVGISYAAAGLILATALKMAFAHKARLRLAVFGTITFVSVALLRLPMLVVLATLCPIGIYLAKREKR